MILSTCCRKEPKPKVAFQSVYIQCADQVEVVSSEEDNTGKHSEDDDSLTDRSLLSILYLDTVSTDLNGVMVEKVLLL